MSDSKSLDAAARELVAAHLEADPGTKEVYLAPDPDGAEIRLVEITESTNTTDEVIPYRFAPDPKRGIPFPSVVVLITPEEWQHCRDGRLELPRGWGRPADLKKLA